MSRSHSLVAALEKSVSGFLTLLGDSRVTKRKVPTTWPGLANKFASYVLEQVQTARTKQKAVEANVTTTMRRIIMLAEEERRSGSRGLLVRRAATLFQHIGEILDVNDLSATSPTGRDYLSILKLLLAEPEYCAAAKLTDWDRLVELHLKWLEKATNIVSEDANRVLGMLSLLLNSYPGEPAPDLLVSMLELFGSLGSVLQESSSNTLSRAGVGVFGAVNAFLSISGVDVAASTPTLHTELHKAALMAVKGKDTKLKACGVQYLRMMLVLGAVERGQQMIDLRNWADTEVEKPQWRASFHGTVAAPLVPAQHALLSLLAATYAHDSEILDESNTSTSNKEEISDDNGCDGEAAAGPSLRPAKRARSSTPALPALGQLASSLPNAAAPIASTVLLQYSLAFPAEQHMEWLRHAVAALPAAFATWAAASTADRPKSSDLLWLLRYVHALALSSQPESDLFSEKAELWQQMWSALVAGAQLLEPPVAELDCVLWALSSIAHRSLCIIPSTSHTLWGLPLLQWDPSPSGVSLLAAALRAGADSAAHAGLWEQAAVKWSCKVPAAEIVDAGEAFLRLDVTKIGARQQGFSPSLDGSSGTSITERPPSLGLIHPQQAQQAWIWWEVDEADEHKIASMICGSTYMRAKARIADADSTAQQVSRARPAQHAAPAPAGVQMHEQLASMLQIMLQMSLQNPPASFEVPASMRGEWLSRLLTGCAAAINVAASVALTTKTSNAGSLPSCWKLDYPLGIQIKTALADAGVAIACVICTVDGLTPAEHAGLIALTAALRRHQTATNSIDLAMPFAEILPYLESVFTMEASAVAKTAAAAVATQAPTQFSVVPTVAAFDDDLDVGATAPIVGGYGGGGTQRYGKDIKSTQLSVQSTASLSRVYKLRCASLLAQLGTVLPVKSAASVEKVLGQTKPGYSAQNPTTRTGNPLPYPVHLLLVGALVNAGCAALDLRFHEGPTISRKALAELDGGNTGGVLSWKVEKGASVPYGRLEFVLERILVLVEALAAPHGLETAVVMGVAASIAGQCFAAAKRQENEEIGTSCALRISLARVAALGLSVKDFFSSGSGTSLTPDLAIEAVANLVNDDQYAARIAASRLIQTVFLRLSDPSGLFNDIASKLDLASNKIDFTTGVAGMASDSGLGETQLERLETSIFMLGETAAACGSFELPCLLKLVREASLASYSIGLVSTTLDWLARALGYPSRYAYASVYGPQLMHSWLVEGGGIDTLVAVRSLVAPSPEAAVDAATFASACVSSLVGPMVLLQDSSGLELLAALLNISVKSVLEKNLDSVLALTYPGIKSKDSTMRKICSRVLSGDAGGVLAMYLGDDLASKFSQHAISGISKMLTSAADPADATALEESERDPLMPYFSPEIVVLAIKDSMNGTTPEEKEELLWSNFLKELQIASLLLEVATHLGRAKHPRHLTTAKGALRAALLLLDDKVAKPATLRYALSILLRMLRTPTLRPTCCILLGSTISHVWSQGDEAIATLGNMLPAVISALVEAVEDTVAEENQRRLQQQQQQQHGVTGGAPGGGGMGGAATRIEEIMPPEDFNQLLRLLENLTLRAPQELLRYLPMVDPVPAVHGMQSIAHVIDQYRHQLSPLQQLTQFASRVASMPHSLRQRSLKALRDVIASNPASLYENNLVTGGGGDGSGSGVSQGGNGGQSESQEGRNDDPSKWSRSKPEVISAAWNLAVQSADLGDPRLAEFAGELLAVAGPLHARSIAFDVAALQKIGKHLTTANNSTSTTPRNINKTTGSRSGSAKPSTSKSQSGSRTMDTNMTTHDTWIAVIEMLSDYVIDEDTAVVKAAQRTLRHVLSTDEGREAEKGLDSGKRNLIQVFGVLENQLGRNKNTAAGHAENARLWAMSGRSYSAWVCDLAYVLLKRADNVVLHACASMAHCKPAFAELLLPLAFADLALHGTAADSDSTSHRVANAITQGLLPGCSKQPKAMRLLLRCLNHLRGMYLDGVKCSNPPSSNSSQKNPHQRPLIASEVTSWRKVYWVDLDYLILAEAAIACRAYFSALMYVETWCEEANRGRLGLPPAESQPRRGEADALLLQIFSNIEEPDGLYAVARSNDLLPQLKRFEREGNWADALASWDLALQLMGPACSRAGNGAGSPSSRSSSVVANISRREAQAGILRCLSNLGASNLLWIASNAPDTGDDGAAAAAAGNFSIAAPSDTAATAAAAELGQWTPLDPGAGEESKAADSGLSAAVAALASGSAERCAQAVTSARRVLVAALATAGLESTGDVNPALVRLQMLHEVTEAWELRWPELPDLGSVGSPSKAGIAGGVHYEGMEIDSLEDQVEFQRILHLWQGREKSAGARYALLAPLQDLRRELLRVLRAPAAEADCLVQSAAAARKAHHFGRATGSLMRLRNLAQSGVVPALAAPDASWRVEEAKSLWARGQTDSALSTIRGLISTTITTNSAFQQHLHLSASAGSGIGSSSQSAMNINYVQAIAAKWMARTKTESSSTVMDLLKVACSGEQIQEARTSRIFYRLAQYSGELYRGVLDRRSSTGWATAQAVLKQKKEELAARTQRYKERFSSKPNTPAAGMMRQTMRQLSLQVQVDENRARELEEQEHEFRLLALDGYGQCLSTGDKYDLPSLFNIVQIWLAHPEDQHVNTSVNTTLREVPSHKFLPLVTQVASRLSTLSPERQQQRKKESDDMPGINFQSILHRMLERLAKEHPFHTLLHIFALKNGNRGSDGHVVQGGVGGGELTYVADQDKVTAAGSVLQHVAATNERLKTVVSELQVAIDCYIELAAINVKKEQSSMAFPANLRRKLIRCKNIPVLSLSLPLDLSLRYDDLPYFSSVSENIPLMNGINKPKLVQVTDSHGNSYKELVKGGADDMRQDAVMQQVFGLLNSLLADAPATAARALSIRTYKIVPFSPAAGLLQWVENTKTLMDCVYYNGEPAGLTKNYYILKDAQAAFNNPNSGVTLEKLAQTFISVTNIVPHTMHKFFLDRFREPGAWFEARLAYTRSTAVNSMAGHIIGLGDRHCSNILIDENTAEVVHIDLGIAFEQGKFLMTPERVPFRLTGNVVDGMGAIGVEGPMRRCCEETLRVLRMQKEALLTVLEVLLHDPLYKWGLTLVQATRRQKESTKTGGDDGEVDATSGGVMEGEDGEAGAVANALVGTADANRTLLQIKQKLEGLEGNDSAVRSVEGQVAHLLTEAMDPNNLARHYIGWMPFL
ncbi:putative Serine/threonine-protein kinase ATM [Nannochloris sp. 'desiccata']|nr:putative Serine/threonine-protein kinase ATM [Chlorella desiccata (nom. nud.)]